MGAAEPAGCDAGKDGREPWLLPFPTWLPSNKYQESSLRKLRGTRCYFISLSLPSSGSLCLLTYWGSGRGKKRLLWGVHLFTQLGEKGRDNR